MSGETLALCIFWSLIVGLAMFLPSQRKQQPRHEQHDHQ